MSGEWSRMRLKHVARLAYGDSLALENREPGDTPVFGSNGVVDYHSSANTRGPAIIIGRKGSFGKVTWSECESFAIDTTYFIDSRFTRASLRWLYYSLHTLRLDDVSQDTGVPGLSREAAYSKCLPVPPLPVQRAIADFLDRKTAAIDELIRKKERLIELLQEKRQALITQAVTKGLDPKVPMKDSGIEWLGEIPAHWEVKRLRHAVRITNEGRLPLSREERSTISGEYPYWGPTGVLDHIDHFRYAGTRVLLGEDGDHFLKYSTQPVAQWATGKFNVNNHAHVLQGTATCSARWLYWSFVRRDLGPDLIAQGVSRLKLTKARLLDIVLPVPPIEEQESLAKKLDNSAAEYTTVQERLRTQIDRLREYRQSLISAAVTGQLPIPTP